MARGWRELRAFNKINVPYQVLEIQLRSHFEFDSYQINEAGGNSFRVQIKTWGLESHHGLLCPGTRLWGQHSYSRWSWQSVAAESRRWSYKQSLGQWAFGGTDWASLADHMEQKQLEWGWGLLKLVPLLFSSLLMSHYLLPIHPWVYAEQWSAESQFIHGAIFKSLEVHFENPHLPP